MTRMHQEVFCFPWCQISLWPTYVRMYFQLRHLCISIGIRIAEITDEVSTPLSAKGQISSSEYFEQKKDVGKQGRSTNGILNDDKESIRFAFIIWFKTSSMLGFYLYVLLLYKWYMLCVPLVMLVILAICIIILSLGQLY